MYLSKLVGKGISEQFNSNYSLSLKGITFKQKTCCESFNFILEFHNLNRNSFNE